MSLPTQLQYHENIFDARAQTTLFDSLKQEIAWKQEHIKLFGKVHPTPRLTAWHGDPHCNYTYSGVVNEPLAWTPALLTIKDRIEQLLHPLNLIAYYSTFIAMGTTKWDGIPMMKKNWVPTQTLPL